MNFYSLNHFPNEKGYTVNVSRTFYGNFTTKSLHQSIQDTFRGIADILKMHQGHIRDISVPGNGYISIPLPSLFISILIYSVYPNDTLWVFYCTSSQQSIQEIFWCAKDETLTYKGPIIDVSQMYHGDIMDVVQFEICL